MDETTKQPHILLVDGMALLFRSFFATAVRGQYFRNADGIPTNGVSGFARHVMTAQTIFQPTHLAVCWDMGAYTFRNDLYEGYKSNRPEPPEELKPQFDMVRNVSEMMGWKNFGEPGMEADDLIGTIIGKFDDVKITVISGDKDLLQLLKPNVQIAFTKKGFNIYDIYSYDRFIEEYQIEPPAFADVKAFMGDSSDGYAGVKGIGPKTALQFIQQYGSVDGVLASLAQLTPSQRKKIEENLDMLHLSKKLAQIHCDCPIEVDIHDFALPVFNEELLHELEATGLGSVARQVVTLIS